MISGHGDDRLMALMIVPYLIDGRSVLVADPSEVKFGSGICSNDWQPNVSSQPAANHIEGRAT